MNKNDSLNLNGIIVVSPLGEWTIDLYILNVQNERNRKKNNTKWFE